MDDEIKSIVSLIKTSYLGLTTVAWRRILITNNDWMQGAKMKPTPFSLFFFILSVAASAVVPSAAHAGRYELIKGKGVEVCEAYKKNLESFSDPFPVMA